MKRRPSLLRSTPPSPRTPSVTRMPHTLGGQIMPVGWNWTYSMSIRSAPASYASACPSPVYSQLLLVILYARPMPPVASTTARAPKTRKRPRSRSYPKAPAIRSASLNSAVTDVGQSRVAVSTEVALEDAPVRRPVEERPPGLELSYAVGRLLRVQLR